MTDKKTEEEQQKIVLALLDAYESQLATLFAAAVRQITNEADLDRIIERLSARDISGAIDAMHISPTPFNRMADELRAIVRDGGDAALRPLPPLRDYAGHRLVIRFNTRAPDVENYIRQTAATLVSEITTDQIAMLRSAIADALAAGTGPRQTALDLVGRVGASGQREGGLIGLSEQQYQWLRTYEQALRALDASALGFSAKTGFFSNFGLRDGRYDRTIARAIRTGTPLTEDQLTAMLSAYRRKALQYRGTMIARTETLGALNTGAYLAIHQSIARGELDPLKVTKKWFATHDNRTRFTHVVLDGQEVHLHDHFESPSGAKLMYPGDPAAPASEVVNCRCWMMYRYDYLAEAA